MVIRSYGPVLGLLLVSVIWGSTFPLGKLVLTGLPVFTYLGLRYFLAAAILFLLYRRAILSVTRREALISLGVGLTLFGSLIFQTVALLYADAAKISFALGLYVVFVPLLSSLFFRARLRPATIAAAVLSLAGLALVAGNRSLMDWDFGVLLTVVSALFTALQIIGVGRYGGRVNAGALAFFQTLVVATLSSAWAVAFEKMPETVSGPVWASLIFLAVFATVLAYVLQCRTQSQMGPATAAIIISTSCVFGALLSWLILDEPFTPSMAAGGLIMFAAMLLSQLTERPKGSA